MADENTEFDEFQQALFDVDVSIAYKEWESGIPSGEEMIKIQSYKIGGLEPVLKYMFKAGYLWGRNDVAKYFKEKENNE